MTRQNSRLSLDVSVKQVYTEANRSRCKTIIMENNKEREKDKGTYSESS